jgi:hypothetical protein
MFRLYRAIIRPFCKNRSTHIQLAVHLGSQVFTMRILYDAYSGIQYTHYTECPTRTEPGISLIILTPMKMLQRNFNMSSSLCEKCDDIITCAGSGHHLRPDRLNPAVDMTLSILFSNKCEQ